MFKVKLSIAFLACLLLFTVNAKADSFTLTAIGSGIDISATLTGTQTGTPGVYDITGMSGMVNGYSATLLPTSGPGTITTSSVVDGWEILYDNVLYTNSTSFFDYYGLGFTANGMLDNLYFSGGDLYAQLGNNPPLEEPISISVVQTPEPGSLMLLVSGMLAMMLLVIRRGRV